MTAYLYRMPVGIAGAISRPQDLTVEPVILKSANAFAAYGLAGKYDADGFFVPLTDVDMKPPSGTFMDSSVETTTYTGSPFLMVLASKSEPRLTVM